MKKTMIITFSLILILGVFVFADGIPTVPHVFSGSVEYSENPESNLEGCEITAIFNNAPTGVVGDVGEENIYEAMVETNDRGGEIAFYIGGEEALPHAFSEMFEIGSNTQLDLTIDELPDCSNSLCGNGVIDFGEQCDGFVPQGITCESLMGDGWTGQVSCSGSCTYDTSQCIPPQGGDNGGNNNNGGGGGGSGSSNSRSSSSTTTSQNSLENLNFEQEENETIELNNDENQEPKSSGITGAVIGFAKSGIGIGLLFAILIIIVVIAIVGFRKRKNKIE